VFRLLRKVDQLGDSYESWAKELKKVQETSLMNFDALSSPERDAIFSLQIGGDF
jgi:hypothetical protein